MRRAITHLKRCDPCLAEVIGRVGPYRMAYRPPEFDALVRSIVYQQLSGKAAATIYARLEQALSGEVTPAAIHRMRIPRLRSFGFSQAKAEYVRDLARKTLNGDLDFERLPSLDDNEVIARLTDVKGIGVWTAQMFLMFALRRPDVLPTADLGIRSAMKRVYGLSGLPKPAEMEELAEPWKPYRSVACWYLWRSLDGPAAL